MTDEQDGSSAPTPVPEPVAGGTRLREVVVGARGIVAVGLAGLVLGGLAGSGLTAVATHDDRGRGKGGHEHHDRHDHHDLRDPRDRGPDWPGRK